MRKNAELLELYEGMYLIRQVELRLGRLFADGEVPGFIHLSIGQEAIATGVASVLRPDDTLASTHRGHGHALAKGVDLDRFFMELMAREGGMCKGRGGSMHVADLSIGMLGANAIVGASIPIALGSALAHQVRGVDAVAVAFFGDGAMAEGTLHESLNMAALWKLPLVFVCENNGWAEFSPTSTQFVAALDKLAKAFGIAYEKADGRDVQAVSKASERAVKAARSGKGPRVLEFTTHRFRGHYEGDPQKYRSADELSRLGEHDPLVLLESQLIKTGVMEAELKHLREGVDVRVEAAVERARRGGAPDFEAGRADVYTQMGAA
ncbi:thiamine pyrophosphate-dependent dehydrogenase E1 component subunit alpha [Billgrantia endophytica]|uniref:ABC transporter substrate-binding protein n=1 Tax=Billgrantia endophytica TaxID=2033802 RepID=A0A2N7U2X1_9GAMM|nr:thiamine pyrophosphate-dependent dehydrogenase E1 component subunit alpha [Halomonas endophytica]PMR74777.1 ABC transporter substrate-binding protein [Halomonas endophytica]